jgi:predicted alpha-1,2-mannosidase
MSFSDRRFLSLVFFGTFAALAWIPVKGTSAPSALFPVDLVEPLVDSANSRWFFFNSATRPFGMVNLSPDMVTSGAWNSGYRYNQDRIRAFSHIHAWQLSGIPVFPTTGAFQGHLGSETYGSAYSHDREQAEVGYHQVFLDDYGINVELTSTTRVGFHRYTFPEAIQSQVLFDFSTFLGPCDTGPSLVRMVSDTELEGFAEMAPTRRRPTPAPVFFVARFDRPFAQLHGWRKGRPVGPIESIEGEDIGAYVVFPTHEGETRLMKVGISYVSVEQARLNLETELDHWHFDQVVADSRREWNSMLGRIEVEGGSPDDRRRFYTDLWHALQGRRIVSDVNGQYADFTGGNLRVGQVPLGPNGKPTFNMYNSDSFWGAQWTINTLWHLVYPEVSESFVNSLLQMYRDGGLIPRGPSGGNYTYVMTGASSTPFIVSAYMKGIRGYDIETAYEGLRKNHMENGIMARAGYEHETRLGGGMRYYLDRGYVPYPLPAKDRNDGFHQDGSGQTLEYAYQDWALSELAAELGHSEDAAYFRKRAENYKHLWNPELGWMWNRTVEGGWYEPVDLLEYHNGWVESNAVQASWFVPQDLEGLAGLMGGRGAMAEKLNRSFEAAKYHGFVSSKSHDKEKTRQNRRVYINYGNQPSMQTAMIFNYAQAPWLTQFWARQVVDTVYSGVSPQYGYSGDEDQGLMGSLAVLMKMGIFSMRGGAAREPIYELSSPLFDRVTIHLHPDYYPGESFVIESEGNLRGSVYIRSAALNGNPLERPWITHHALVQGGSIRYTLSNQPDKDFWAAPEAVPPSMSTE